MLEWIDTDRNEIQIKTFMPTSHPMFHMKRLKELNVLIQRGAELLRTSVAYSMQAEIQNIVTQKIQ